MTERKSNEQHKKDGTYRKDRHGAFDLPPSIPKQPYGMSVEAKLEWDKLTPVLLKIGMITEADSLAVKLLCESIVLYNKAQKSVQDDGILIESHTKYGVVKKQNPSVPTINQTWTQIVTLLKQFGMTPQARGQKPDSSGEESQEPVVLSILTPGA